MSQPCGRRVTWMRRVPRAPCLITSPLCRIRLLAHLYVCVEDIWKASSLYAHECMLTV